MLLPNNHSWGYSKTFYSIMVKTKPFSALMGKKNKLARLTWLFTVSSWKTPVLIIVRRRDVETPFRNITKVHCISLSLPTPLTSRPVLGCYCYCGVTCHFVMLSIMWCFWRELWEHVGTTGATGYTCGKLVLGPGCYCRALVPISAAWFFVCMCRLW